MMRGRYSLCLMMAFCLACEKQSSQATDSLPASETLVLSTLDQHMQYLFQERGYDTLRRAQAKKQQEQQGNDPKLKLVDNDNPWQSPVFIATAVGVGVVAAGGAIGAAVGAESQSASGWAAPKAPDVGKSASVRLVYFEDSAFGHIALQLEAPKGKVFELCNQKPTCFLSWGSASGVPVGAGYNNPANEGALSKPIRVVELPPVDELEAQKFAGWLQTNYLQFDSKVEAKAYGYNIGTQNCAHAAAGALDQLYGGPGGTRPFLTPEILYRESLDFAKKAGSQAGELEILGTTFVRQELRGSPVASGMQLKSVYTIAELKELRLAKQNEIATRLANIEVRRSAIEADLVTRRSTLATATAGGNGREVQTLRRQIADLESELNSLNQTERLRSDLSQLDADLNNSAVDPKARPVDTVIDGGAHRGLKNGALVGAGVGLLLGGIAVLAILLEN